MNYLNQWKAISSRIKGLMSAAELDAHYLAASSSASYRRWTRIQIQNEKIINELIKFKTEFHESLPPRALETIQDFITNTDGIIRDKTGTPDLQQERARDATVMVAAFETEMSFLLGDEQEAIRLRSERAFAHLQRLIVADEEFRNKWIKAFEKGERKCEQLGGVHLLYHGIWAFKVKGEGARTDLVFQEPIDDFSKEKSYAEGIVLTEWKVVRKKERSQSKFEEARLQAKDYSQGLLGGIELSGYRYAVVVSEKQVDLPSDKIIKGVVWRHINIAVKPESPSKASRRKKKVG